MHRHTQWHGCLHVDKFVWNFNHRLTCLLAVENGKYTTADICFGKLYFYVNILIYFPVVPTTSFIRRSNMGSMPAVVINRRCPIWNITPNGNVMKKQTRFPRANRPSHFTPKCSLNWERKKCRCNRKIKSDVIACVINLSHNVIVWHHQLTFHVINMTYDVISQFFNPTFATSSSLDDGYATIGDTGSCALDWAALTPVTSEYNECKLLYNLFPERSYSDSYGVQQPFHYRED